MKLLVHQFIRLYQTRVIRSNPAPCVQAVFGSALTLQCTAVSSLVPKTGIRFHSGAEKVLIIHQINP